MKQNKIFRDISWLSFNERVMQEAKDESNQLYDRLRFLGIFSNNQDEFFRVRIAALTRMLHLKKSAKINLEEQPQKVLAAIQVEVAKQQRNFIRTFTTIVNELKQEHIFLKTEKQLSPIQQKFAHRYFEEKVRTAIVPLMIESIANMPLLHDKSLYLACVLGIKGNAALRRYALIEIPVDALERFILLPSAKGTHDIILLEDVIRYNLNFIFGAFGYNHFLSYIIKVTRDAEFDIDNDVNSNLISELEKGIKGRKKGRATRFDFEKTIDPQLLDYLTRRLSLSKNDNLLAGGRIHNFKDFMNFPKEVFKNLVHLKESRKPFVHALLKQPCSIMNVLDKQDVLLHFPYHSFDPIIDLLREAAIDPNVQSLKVTCYRLAKDSKIINAIINVARNGKHVTAVLELRARFDEEANLKWKNILEEEGVKVIWGIPNMKVHAKICIIKKKALNRTKLYGFISTGNLNEATAKHYSDHCLLTANKKILSEVDKVFTVIEGAPHPKLTLLKDLKYLIVSPTNTRKHFINLINNEIKAAKNKMPASITIKLNSLVDEALIQKIYEAAEAGVEVNLIIRGICCVLTQQKSFKKKIKAISIIDEYLEHSRIMTFHNNGNPLVYISSADWMMRNLDYRIEVSCPILDKKISQELVDFLNIQLQDNASARILDNGQKNNYAKSEIACEPVQAQLELFKYFLNK